MQKDGGGGTQTTGDGMRQKSDSMQQSMYRRFVAMVLASTALMFGLMYLNTYAFEHVFFSQTRLWMAFVMGGAMGMLMLAFMWSMYKNKRANIIIITVSAIVFAVALWLVRSQQTVDDVSYMKAMIPHHSIAIMTSERAHIRDPRTRKLAKGIIEAQRREIAQMKYLIDDIGQHGVRQPSRQEPTP